MLWAGLIAFLSSSSFRGEETGGVVLPLLRLLLGNLDPAILLAIHQAIRKLGHFAEYLVLGLLLYRALHQGYGFDRRAAVRAVVLATLYAVADELHQSFVPGRTAGSIDCLIDATGAAAGQGLLAARARRSEPGR